MIYPKLSRLFARSRNLGFVGALMLGSITGCIATDGSDAAYEDGASSEDIASLEQAATAAEPVRAAGFTTFTKSTDTRVYYVSSSGSDSNDGLSEARPLKTPAAASSKIRSGYPDWILFKRGDRFSQLGRVWASGRSMTEPMLFGSYGTSKVRPRFVDGGFFTNGGGGGPQYTSYVAMSGLDFNIERRNPSSANHDPALSSTLVQWLRGTNGLLFEDCVFQWAMLTFEEGDGFQGKNVTFKRTQFLDHYSTNGHSQGIYMSGYDNVTFDECLFDHNGWVESVVGGKSTIFNHNMYFQNGTKGVKVLNSISMRASSHGVQLRGGGQVENSFFYRNPINILIGGGSTPDAGGVQGTVRNNVIVESVNMVSGEPRGAGIDLENINSAVVENNLLANCLGNGCDSMDRAANVTYGVNTIYNWRGSFTQGSKESFKAPTVTLATYAGTLGMTLNQFYDALRLQSQFNWRTDLTAPAINVYFRNAFSPR